MLLKCVDIMCDITMIYINMNQGRDTVPMKVGHILYINSRELRENLCGYYNDGGVLALRMKCIQTNYSDYMKVI